MFGAMPPKGQELDDHYFGTIRQRIAAFMRDVNDRAVESRCNSKDTAQRGGYRHSTSWLPIYAEANIAVDHNQISHADLEESSMPAWHEVPAS